MSGDMTQRARQFRTGENALNGFRAQRPWVRTLLSLFLCQDVALGVRDKTRLMKQMAQPRHALAPPPDHAALSAMQAADSIRWRSFLCCFRRVKGPNPRGHDPKRVPPEDRPSDRGDSSVDSKYQHYCFPRQRTPFTSTDCYATEVSGNRLESHGKVVFTT